jgi:hypothetical protein
MTDDDLASGRAPAPDVTPFRMTDLEETLFGPRGGARTAELLERFNRLHAELDTQVAGGMPPDEYARAAAIGNALAAARDLLVRFSQPPQRG